MMEKLEAPQTHLGLKNMMKEVDEDLDGKLSFREVRVTLALAHADMSLGKILTGGSAPCIVASATSV